MIGVIIALPIEASAFSLKTNVSHSVYRVHDDLLMIISGMGVNNTTNATKAIIEHGATSLISFGTAAGLSAEFNSGTLCMPQFILDESGTQLMTDPFMHHQFSQELGDLHPRSVQKMVTSTTFLTTADQKRALHHKTGAIAADMESFIIGSLALQADLPFLVLRVIVDPAHAGFSDVLAHCLTKTGNINYKPLLWSLYRNPLLMIQLVKMGCYFKKSHKKLSLISSIIVNRP